MADSPTEAKPLHHNVPEAKAQESTLLPMLIGGLVLILVGSLIVMSFV